MDNDKDPVLVTGARGFIGRNLIPALQAEGVPVVGASRDPDRARRSNPSVIWRQMDVDQPETVAAALQGCRRAVYLVHAMGSGEGYAEKERRAAISFRTAAEQAGIVRIVYLGGIQPERATTSRHLRSRLLTGKFLRQGSVSTIELRAAMVIGGGSESWRIVRDLAVRLPLMVLPAWLESRSQPVSIRDVTRAIAAALTMDVTESRAFALPGPELLSGREILERTAQLCGVRARIVRVPVVTPRLSSYWLRLVTRADGHIARELVEGLRHDLIANGDIFWNQLPEHRLEDFDVAAKRALKEEAETLATGTRFLERLMRPNAR